MSDPFSIVAGVCGLAVQIVDTGIKIKKLYEQFDGASSSLRDTIDLIQLHATDLSPAIPIGNQDGISPQIAAVLAVSEAYCRKVLGELQEVAGELHAQLEKAQSRGSARRRLATLKIVLKKDVLAQHEARLGRASSFLMQAKLSCIMTLVQQLRVEIRVPDARAPMDPLDSGRGQMPEAPRPGNGQETTTYMTAKETCFSEQSSLSPGGMRPSRLSGPFYRAGLTRLTGCVEIHFPAPHCRCPHCPEAIKDGRHSQNDPFWLKLRLPRWICNIVIESSIIHSTTGWLHHITTYRLHNSTASEAIINTIAAGDIPKLRRLFQTRELKPRDTVFMDSIEHTLAEVAILRRQWDVGTFLLNHGADTGGLVILRNPQSSSSQPLSWRKRSDLIGQSYSDVKFYIESGIGLEQDRALQAYKAVIGSTLDENDLLSRLVVDEKRISSQRLVDTFLEFQPSVWFMGQIRRLLGGIMDTSKPLRPESYDVYLNVVDQMNINFWRIWEQPADVFAAYRALFRDLVCEEVREHYGDTSREVLLDSRTMLRWFWRGFEIHRMCTDRTDQLVHAWFEMTLGANGISGQGWADVVQGLMDEGQGREYLAGWNIEPRLYTRLIGVTGGPRPEDWKFWWSQRTDGLVGEFWSLVEQEEEEGFAEAQPLCTIPGAWVE